MAKNQYTRLGTFLFIIGALLSVMDSAFPLASAIFPDTSQTRSLIYILLIFTGVFAGILNITEDEEHHFLVSAATFLLVILSFNQIFADQTVVHILTHFFQNAVAFIGSMALVVALKTVLEFGSDNNRVTPVEYMQIRTDRLEELDQPPWLRRWHFVIFLAVALTFFLILFEIFFQLPSNFMIAVEIIDWLVTVIFVVDLFILFRQEKTWGAFLKNCWLDIVAAIPFGGVLQSFKIIRLSRIAKVAKSAKFFSKDSGVNGYLERGEVHEDPVDIPEHPRVPQRKAGKR